MKLRNKKTGEIVDCAVYCNGTFYHSVNDVFEEWEDYEEPEAFGWRIDEYNEPEEIGFGFSLEELEYLKEIGLWFKTKEETEKAIEKLKAWKRLRDKGFKVDLWDYDGGNYQERIKTGRILFRVKDYEENDKDLDLLFGGEE